jgi:hypothetical protein
VEDQFSKSQHLEGKLTHIHYTMPENHSALEVFRNYEAALKSGGFVELFSCVGGAQCNPKRSTMTVRNLAQINLEYISN